MILDKYFFVVLFPRTPIEIHKNEKTPEEKRKKEVVVDSKRSSKRSFLFLWNAFVW